jgi:hypothetical protein
MPSSTASTDTDLFDEATAPPAALGATDRLGLIYASPGPYVSAYLQTRSSQDDDHADGRAARWFDLRSRLVADGAPERALEALDARITLPIPAETAGVGIIAAADGHTVVDHAMEPPRHDLAVLDTLPYAAPLLEWDQRRVPHLVVITDGSGIDAVEFLSDGRAEMTSLEGEDADLVEVIRTHVKKAGTRLVVVGGDRVHAQTLADALVPRVGPKCNVVAEFDETTDGLAAATVRYVSDTAATETVGFLREFRFLAEHRAAVDGMEATIEALRSREPGTLLIHDDPADERRVWLGADPTELSATPVEGWTGTGRFVDAAIRAAIASDTPVHVIPSTGSNRPDDDVALIRRSAPGVEPI